MKTHLTNPMTIFEELLFVYESDTFSAVDSKLSPEESKKLAKFFFARDFRKFFDNIDGTQINETLIMLRDGVIKEKDFEIDI